MFNQDLMTQMNSDLNLSAESLEALQARLVGIGLKFRPILDVTPTNLNRGPADVSLSERSNWLAREVMAPTRQLLASIANRSMFSQYPERHSSALSDEDLTALSGMLERLAAFSADLKSDFDQRGSEGASHNQEIRFELVDDLAAAFRAVGVSVARGNYLPRQGDTGRMSHVIRLAIFEITGSVFPTDHHLKDLAKLARKSK